MPKVFLVKRRSPGVSVRSWDELPDEERADTYIPGEHGSGGQGLARGSSCGEGWGERVPSSHPLGVGDSPPPASSRGRGGSLRGAGRQEGEAGKPWASCSPSP